MRCDLLEPFVADAFPVLQVYFIILLPRVNRRPGRGQSSDEFSVPRAACNDDSAAFAGHIHERERVKVTLESVNRITGSRFADDKWAHLRALGIITPRAVFRPVVNCHDGAFAIVDRKREATLILPDKPILL